jgi:CRISPR-associated protein Cas1
MRKWDNVILSKTQELARLLLQKSDDIEFVEPVPELKRSDSSEIRRRILELTQSEAQRLGIGKSTLHYLRNYATSRPFGTVSRVCCGGPGGTRTYLVESLWFGKR